jgi:two-component system, chemotaxis family, protein-glutamate methylesterase/glutaminase
MGASAGGVEALTTVVGSLPSTLEAAVLVVLHLSPASYSALPGILDRQAMLPVSEAIDGAPIEPGHVYVAPPDRHLMVDDSRIRLDDSPTVNLSRPSIDRLFVSAAHARGQAVVGVILSGMLDDGTRGLLSIQAHGGVAVVQDPSEAVFPGMPTSAVRFGNPRYVTALEDIAPLLVELSTAHLGTAPMRPAQPVDEVDDVGRLTDRRSTGLTCPECGGALWELDCRDYPSFRCRIGHQYSPETLATAQGRALERALWAAVTSLEEQAELAERLAARLGGRGLDTQAARHEQQSGDARRRSLLVRRALEGFSDLAGSRDALEPSEQ